MNKDIEKFVVEFDIYQYKGEILNTLCKLQPLPITPTMWTDKYMDFMVELPKYGNKSVIMMVVDKLSKYVHFCALQHPFKASIMTQVFMDNNFKLHGIPESIIIDHDFVFVSNFL